MYPLALCSIFALAIIFERLWVLRLNKVAPADLVYEVWKLVESNQSKGKKMQDLVARFPLATVFLAGLNSSKYGREVMVEQLQNTASQELHHLKRFLNMLGTIAVISPLLGLLGTVLGMIELFITFRSSLSGEPNFIASGIAQALITTAFGLAIAIPSVAFHRFFLRNLDDIAVAMEHQCAILINLLFRTSSWSSQTAPGRRGARK